MDGGIYDVAGGDASSTTGISYIPQFSDVTSRERFCRMLGIYEVLWSETEQNLGEGRAEPRTVYPLLSDPSVTQRSESAAGCER